ncbi:ABC transporter substrate-binding protein [Escherichia coli]|nr:ABC transporter substrate-binding protein [Escherichia coli]
MSRRIWSAIHWNLVKKLGNAAADYFIANKIDQPKIAVINCEAFEVCVQRRKGFEEVLKARVPGAQIVANQEGTVLDKAISVGEKTDYLHAGSQRHYGGIGRCDTRRGKSGT